LDVGLINPVRAYLEKVRKRF